MVTYASHQARYMTLWPVEVPGLLVNPLVFFQTACLGCKGLSKELSTVFAVQVIPSGSKGEYEASTGLALPKISEHDLQSPNEAETSQSPAAPRASLDKRQEDKDGTQENTDDESIRSSTEKTVSMEQHNNLLEKRRHR